MILVISISVFPTSIDHGLGSLPRPPVPSVHSIVPVCYYHRINPIRLTTLFTWFFYLLPSLCRFYIQREDIIRSSPFVECFGDDKSCTSKVPVGSPPEVSSVHLLAPLCMYSLQYPVRTFITSSEDEGKSIEFEWEYRCRLTFLPTF